MGGQTNYPAGPARAWFWPAVISLLASAVLAALPFALHNWSFMDSDHGVIGLMARHIAQARHFPIYIYGQGYVGTPEVYWLALFFLFLPASPLALGLAMLALLAIYLVFSAALIRRGAGPAAALACLALAAMAPPFFAKSFSLSWPSHTMIMLLGVLFQFMWVRLCLPEGQKDRPGPAWLAGLGAVFFLGLWSKALFVFFVLPGFFINLYFIGSACRGYAAAQGRDRPRGAAGVTGAVLKGLGALYLAYAFSVLAYGESLVIELGGLCVLCTDPKFAGSQDLVIGGLLLAAGFILPWWFRLGKEGRRAVLAKAGSSFGALAAMAAGLAAQKALDLLFRATPEAAWGRGTHYLHMVTPKGVLLRWELLWSTWVPRAFLPDGFQGQAWAAYALFLLILAAAAWIFVWAFLAWRRGGFAPWFEQNWLAFFCAASFALFLLAMLFSAASQDGQSTRYMSVLYAWWPFLLYWLIRRLAKAQWVMGAALGVFLLALLAYPLVSQRLARANWTPTYWQDAPQAKELLGLLQKERVRFGHADYWAAYLLDFLTGERLILSPAPEYDLGRVRYPPYAKLLEQAAKKAYVFRRPQDMQALVRVEKKLRARGRPFTKKDPQDWVVLISP